MDRNAILSGLMSSFSDYSDNYTVSVYKDRIVGIVVDEDRAKAVFDAMPATPTLLCPCDAYRKTKLFAISDFRTTDGAEKVLKYSGDSADLVQRADIKREAVVFRYQGATTNFLIEDSKPTDLEQAWDVLVFVEQGDSHSVKEARYDRMLELTDQIIDWSYMVSPAGVDQNLYTITLTGATATVEFEGYLSTNLTFNSSIKIQ